MTREGFGEELHIAHIDIEDHIDINAFTIIASVHQLASVSLCCCVVASCVVASLYEFRWQASHVHSARAKYQLPAQSGVSAYQCVPLSIIQVYNSEAGM